MPSRHKLEQILFATVVKYLTLQWSAHFIQRGKEHRKGKVLLLDRPHDPTVKPTGERSTGHAYAAYNRGQNRKHGLWNIFRNIWLSLRTRWQNLLIWGCRHHRDLVNCSAAHNICLVLKFSLNSSPLPKWIRWARVNPAPLIKSLSLQLSV